MPIIWTLNYFFRLCIYSIDFQILNFDVEKRLYKLSKLGGGNLDKIQKKAFFVGKPFLRGTPETPGPGHALDLNSTIECRKSRSYVRCESNPLGTKSKSKSFEFWALCTPPTKIMYHTPLPSKTWNLNETFFVNNPYNLVKDASNKKADLRKKVF